MSRYETISLYMQLIGKSIYEYAFKSGFPKHLKVGGGDD